MCGGVLLWQCQCWVFSHAACRCRQMWRSVLDKWGAHEASVILNSSVLTVSPTVADWAHIQQIISPHIFVFTFVSPGDAAETSCFRTGFLDRICYPFFFFFFTRVCFHSVLCPCFERESLTDWGGQMTVQVWVGANPSSRFVTQGRRWRGG